QIDRDRDPDRVLRARVHRLLGARGSRATVHREKPSSRTPNTNIISLRRAPNDRKYGRTVGSADEPAASAGANVAGSCGGLVRRVERDEQGARDRGIGDNRNDAAPAAAHVRSSRGAVRREPVALANVARLQADRRHDAVGARGGSAPAPAAEARAESWAP